MPPRRHSSALRGNHSSWLVDPSTFEQPSRGRLRRRRLALLVVLLLSMLAVLAWWRLPFTPASRPPDASHANTQAHPVRPPAPVKEDSPVAPDDGPMPQANLPAFLSDDTNLSFARRAGLHRAENPLGLTATAVIAIDAQTGETLFSRNATVALPIASLSKLLTAMVVLDSGVPLSARIAITSNDVDRLRNSRSRLQVGTRLSRSEALRLALMSSDNRAAHALARTHPDGIDEFVQRMNVKAQNVGAVQATFTDPTGLSNANRATARDVAALVAAAAKYPLLRQFTTTSKYLARFGKRRLTYLNSNRLVRLARWPIRLQKTGYIVEAGWCLAMTLRVSRRSINVVLLDSGSVAQRDEDARKLRRWLKTQASRK